MKKIIALLKLYKLKYLLGVVLSAFGGLIFLEAATDNYSQGKNIAGAILASFFMGVFFYLVFCYKDKYRG
jgi:4-hydroxybenzoate polyprenyltransferase